MLSAPGARSQVHLKTLGLLVGALYRYSQLWHLAHVVTVDTPGPLLAVAHTVYVFQASGSGSTPEFLGMSEEDSLHGGQPAIITVQVHVGSESLGNVEEMKIEIEKISKDKIR